MQVPIVLGIIGATPSGFVGRIVTSDFRGFQKRTGLIEGASTDAYPGCHAVCHAHMNGVQHVVFIGVSSVDDDDTVRAATSTLLAEADVVAIVIPGLAAGPPAARLAAHFLREVGDRPLTLWVDAPRGVACEDILAYRQTLPLDDRVRVALPFVNTISPSRRSFEPLAPTALIAPLFLGTTKLLRGVHNMPKAPSNQERDALREAGCGLLTTSGPRRKVALAFPPALATPTPDNPPPSSLEERIGIALDEVRESALSSGRRGRLLWKIVERQTRAALYRFKSSGEITGFRLQLDETSLNDPHGIAFDVFIATPKRVEQFVLRTQLLE